MLIAASALADDKHRADKEAVIRQCEGTVIEGRTPDHEASLEYASEVGLLHVDGRFVVLTGEGLTFLDMNPEKLYDLSEGQRKFLIRACYLHGKFREESFKLLSMFSPSYARDTYRWSWVDGPPLEGDANILEQLRELGLLVREQAWYEINAEFVDAVAAFLSEGKGFSEEKFMEYLHEREEVGKVAESLVVEFEGQRLRDAGHVAEALSVRRISRLRANAGYDIESFDGKSRGVNYDRFIEVKGAKSSKVHFIWSDNEMRIAKKLGPRYWIYFQGGIDLNSKKAKNKLLMFQNPIETILKDARFATTAQGVIVESEMRGELVAVA